MLIGRFYFKITPSGNLIGEYSHRNPSSQGSFAEAATRSSPGSSWVGDYRTVWCEGPSNSAESAYLKITQSASGVFSVLWCESLQPNAKVIFDGEAILCDGMLVGDYHD